MTLCLSNWPRWSRAILIAVFVAASSATAFAQVDVPMAELSGGVTITGLSDDDAQRSWFVEGAINLSHWFSVVVAADRATSSPTHSFAYRYTRTVTSGGTVVAQTYDVETIKSHHMITGGARFSGRESRWVSPFVQALAGYANASTTLTASPQDTFAEAVVRNDSGSGTGLVLQAGGGLNLIFVDALGAVAELNYRRMPNVKTGAVRAREGFQGFPDPDFTATTSELYVTFGVTVRFGRR